DINNTIDHRPEGDEKWFLENEKTVTQFCRKLAAERPLKDIRDEYNYPKKKGIKDECSRLLEASTMKSRRGFAIQRLIPHLLTLWVCKLLMLICILTKNVITSCSVTMMLFLHLEVKPLMTLTTVLYLSCALISGHLAMMLMEL